MLYIPYIPIYIYLFYPILACSIFFSILTSLFSLSFLLYSTYLPPYPPTYPPIEWDVLGETLPSEHTALDYGFSPDSSYEAWSTGGAGGGPLGGGAAGVSGSYLVKTSGEAEATMVDGLVAGTYDHIPYTLYPIPYPV